MALGVRVRSVVAGIAVTMAILGTPASASTRAWLVETHPLFGTPGLSYFRSVAFEPGTKNQGAWAFGSTDAGTLGPVAAVQHRTSTGWATVPDPVPASHSSLNDGVALSRRNAWAVGSYEPDTVYVPLIEHWNGTSWKVARSPTPAQQGYLGGVTMVSANLGWAVGTLDAADGTPDTPLIESRNGSVWTTDTSLTEAPPGSGLNSVCHVPGSADSWAAGSTRSSNKLRAPFVVHNDGSGWQQVQLPAPATWVELESVACVGLGDVWVVGAQVTGKIESPLVEHWDGATWSVVPAPSGGRQAGLAGIAAIPGSAGLWAVGWVTHHGTEGALAERWNGTKWRIVPTPTPADSCIEVHSDVDTLDAVAAANSRIALAVGGYCDDYQGLIERYH